MPERDPQGKDAVGVLPLSWACSWDVRGGGRSDEIEPDGMQEKEEVTEADAVLLGV